MQVSAWELTPTLIYESFIQNQSIKAILGTPVYVSINDLYDSAGLTPIKEHLIQRARRSCEQ